MRVHKIILFLTSAILLHYAESILSSWSRNHIQEPANGVLPSRFFYLHGSIHELNHPNARPFVVDDYFIGMESEGHFRPIFNDHPYRVYSFRNHQLVDISGEERSRLLEGLPLAPLSVEQRRQQEQQLQHRGSTSGLFGGPEVFSGLPPRYFYANGTLHERERPKCRPVIIENYFFGMIDGRQLIYPVDPLNAYRVYSLISRTMVTISHDLRNHLLNEA